MMEKEKRIEKWDYQNEWIRFRVLHDMRWCDKWPLNDDAILFSDSVSLLTGDKNVKIGVSNRVYQR